VNGYNETSAKSKRNTYKLGVVTEQITSSWLNNKCHSFCLHLPYVIAHPGVGSGLVSKAARMASSTAERLAFAVLTTERKAA